MNPIYPQAAQSNQGPSLYWPRGGPPHYLSQYGASQYGSPQYGGSQYGLPQYGASQYGSPQYGGSQYGSRQSGIPQYGMTPTGNEFLNVQLQPGSSIKVVV